MAKVQGNIDGFEGNYLVGWAIADPDIDACSIRIVDMTGRSIAGGEAARERPDLEVLGKGRKDFAFRILLADLGAADRVRVYANDVELPGSPVMLGPGVFDGSFAVRNGVVIGWVTERNPRFGAPFVTILSQEGEIVAEGHSTLDSSGTDPFFAPAKFALPLSQSSFGQGELSLRALADGVAFAQAVAGALRLEGFLEVVSPQRCSGWLVSPDAPQRHFDIEILRNGGQIGSGTSNLPREDVRDRFPSSWRTGFDIALAADESENAEVSEFSVRLAGSTAELFKGPFVVGERTAVIAAARNVARLSYASAVPSALERSILQAALADFIQKQRRAKDYLVLPHVGAIARSRGKRRLNIIIPIYRDVEITRACINSVLAHRNPELDSIVLVNDCSPDADMAAMLRRFKTEPNTFLLTNPTNRGFVQSVNRAVAFCHEGDVVLLNSDTRVFEGGFDELWRVAHEAPDIGTVTAISNNATIFTYPHATLAVDALADIGWQELAKVALRDNRGLVVDVPTGHGFCMLVRREVLQRVGHFDEKFGRGYGEENDLCCRAADLGFRNVAAAGVFVEHRESISFGSEKQALVRKNLALLAETFPEYTPTVMAWERRDDLRKARWALDAARLRLASEAGRSFVLVIENWLGGGTSTAIKDIEAAVDYGAIKLSLTSRRDGYLQLEAKERVLLALFAPGEEGALFSLLSAARIELVLVHQLLGFSLKFITRFGAWVEDRRAVYFAHDFYPFCPRVDLIDATGGFCNVPDVAVCERCVSLGGTHEASRLGALSVAAHRELFVGVLKKIGQVVVPSRNTADYFNGVFPDLPVRAIPHPQFLSKFPTTPRGGSYDDIVILGAIGANKGSAMLLEIARRARLSHPKLRFHVIGYTDRDKELLAFGNVTITGPYTAAELPALVGETPGAFALFLHGWPETFSYTLSEAVGFGLIPLVPDIGAPAERVRAAQFGVVFPFPIEVGQVLKTIEDIAAGRLPPSTANAGPDRYRPAPQPVADLRALLQPAMRPPARAPAPGPDDVANNGAAAAILSEPRPNLAGVASEAGHGGASNRG